MKCNSTRSCFLLMLLCLQFAKLDASFLRSIYHRQSEHQRLINNADMNDNLIVPVEVEQLSTTASPVPALVMTERGDKRDLKPVFPVGLKGFPNQVLRPIIGRSPVPAHPYISRPYPSGPFNYRVLHLTKPTTMPLLDATKYRGMVGRPTITLSRVAGIIRAREPMRTGFADKSAHQFQPTYKSYKGYIDRVGNPNMRGMSLDKKDHPHKEIYIAGRIRVGMLNQARKPERIPMIKIRMAGGRKVEMGKTDMKETFGKGRGEEGSRKEATVGEPKQNLPALELEKDKAFQLNPEAAQRAVGNREKKHWSSTTRRPSYSTWKAARAGRARANPGGISVKKDLSKHATSPVPPLQV